MVIILKYIKIMIFSIVLLAVLSISAVSAFENSTDNAADMDESNLSIVNIKEDSLNEKMLANESHDNVLNYENGDFQSSQKENSYAIIEAEYTSFTNLDYLISTSGNLTTLNRDFIFNRTYDADYVNGIEIRGNELVIDGDNHIIDGNNLARMFNVSGDNITFKNINFINGYSAGDGGIIYCKGNNFTIINCTFSNGRATVEGGALFVKSDNAKIIASKFFNNNAIYNAAVYMNGINSTVMRSYFENNVAEISAGAIGWAKKSNGIISDSIFVNNTAFNEGGGAVFWNQGLNGKILNCTFENNNAVFNGSALFLNSDDTFVSDCVFIGNNASDLGGAIFVKRQTAYIKNSRFINNSADTGGAIGAFYNVDIDSCIFSGNVARQQNDNVAILVKIIGVNVKNVIYGETVSIVVKLTRQSGNVSIVINNKKYSAVVVNGTATIKIPNLDAAIYNGTVTYSGNANCTSPQRNVQFAVNIQTPTITARSTGFVINYGGKYCALLKDENAKRLPGKKIKFILAGKYISYATTNRFGIAIIKFTPKTLKTLKAGNGALIIELNSKNYKKVAKSVNIKINKEKTKIISKKATFNVDKRVKMYSILLKNSKNKAIKKVIVTLKVNGKLYKAKTNYNGKATFKIINLNRNGRFTSLVRFAGNKYYNAKSVKSQIIVK